MEFRPTFEEFKAAAAQGDLVPVYRELLADMETPVTVFSRFTEDDHAFLLESVEGGQRWGRYSFIGMHPHAVFEVHDGKPSLQRNGVTEQLDPNGCPIEALRNILAESKTAPVPGLPRFFGGAVGYLGYETVRSFESLPEPKGTEEWPESCLLITDQMIIFDTVRHTLKALACIRPAHYDSLEEAYAAAQMRVESLIKRLQKPANLTTSPTPSKEPQISSPVSDEEYMSMVERAKQYIVDGDIIQVVLSRPFETQVKTDPLHIYRALRLVNPSPYTFCLKMGNRQLIGSSPEVMVRLTDDKVELRPIAGTRPRGVTEQQDHALADELLADEKERAEHLMLVDLGRNDLGRLAVPGSVQVSDFMTIERYSHVMHIVSHVQAVLDKPFDAFDVIRATFPAGTLSGAPKVRAMEIIHEMESRRRGPYGGAVGYIGYDGNMDLAITIRTLQLQGNKVTVQAGAGIVYDSDPQTEADETRHKAQGAIKALELAATGLNITPRDPFQ